MKNLTAVVLTASMTLTGSAFGGGLSPVVVEETPIIKEKPASSISPLLIIGLLVVVGVLVSKDNSGQCGGKTKAVVVC